MVFVVRFGEVVEGPAAHGGHHVFQVAGAGNQNHRHVGQAFPRHVQPPLVIFAPNEKSGGGPKDTLANVREIREFTVSIVSESLAQAMNETSREVARGVNEFELAGLTPVTSHSVRPCHVAEARAVLECTVWDIVALPSRPGGRGSHLVIGAVIGIHIDDELIVDGRVETKVLAPVSRLGYFDYGVVRDPFEMKRPD